MSARDCWTLLVAACILVCCTLLHTAQGLNTTGPSCSSVPDPKKLPLPTCASTNKTLADAKKGE